MKIVVWLAVNSLRWLVVVAVIAWANPWLYHLTVAAPIYQPVMQRSIQSKPCAPWAIELGRWYGQYTCGEYPGADSRYRLFLKRG